VLPHFAHPLALLFLSAVPLLLWRWLRRRRGALRYSDTRFLADLPIGRGRIARWGGIALRAAALILLILALAGLRWPDLRTRVATEGIAIGMVVDVSGSMAEPDFQWGGQPISRLEAVKRAFTLFVAGGDGPDGEHLDGRPDDLIGLVTFAALPENTCPLTLSHSVLLHLLDSQRPRSLPTESETNIGDALAWGLYRLESAANRRKVLILLSDGEHNVPPPALKPRQAAQLAANLHVPIYTIDAGGEPSAKETEGDNAQAMEQRAEGERSLQAIAKLTGGRSFKARDTKSLLAVCQAIDHLERQEIQSFQYRRYYEAYPWLAGAALALLVGVQLLELTIWQRVP
jgi:Ca-activated chloride channel family protein